MKMLSHGKFPQAIWCKCEECTKLRNDQKIRWDKARKVKTKRA